MYGSTMMILTPSLPPETSIAEARAEGALMGVTADTLDSVIDQIEETVALGSSFTVTYAEDENEVAYRHVEFKIELLFVRDGEKYMAGGGVAVSLDAVIQMARDVYGVDSTTDEG